MTPQELKAGLDRGENIIILDVREPDEFAIVNLGGTLIPLSELPWRHREIDMKANIVCLCHHGVRSAQAAGFLKSQGYEKVRNLSGGIHRYALEVDPSLPKY